ncbi:transcription factor PAR1-like [Forsythia ovata]|uniref:Transcription factor PAR1-like n=1 Tax=Forsythia ovata TaxID=205694 RepID=A0ABD1S7G6_9LAMI
MESSNRCNCASEPETIATLSRKEETNPEMGLAVQESDKANIRRVRQQESHRRSIKNRTHVKKISKDVNGHSNGVVSGGGEESDEKAEVEKKIVALQKIVPGGDSLGVDKLFEETAEYILTLQCQVKVLRFLASYVEGPEIEKRKLGGVAK